MTDERLSCAKNTPRVLFIAMVCHCAAELTDGRIPGSLMPVLYAQSRARKRDLDELIELGLVERLGNVPGSPVSDDYYLPAYLNWNPRRDEIERKRQLSRDRQAALRERKAPAPKLRSIP